MLMAKVPTQVRLEPLVDGAVDEVAGGAPTKPPTATARKSRGRMDRSIREVRNR